MDQRVEKLFEHGLKDAYDAEQQFASALETMIDQASDETLVNGFRRHLDVTKEQAKRVEDCFRAIGKSPEREHCAGAEGLVKEYKSFVSKENPDEDTLDLFAAGAALRVEHYEIASYSSLVEMAEQMGQRECARLLQRNLAEERATATELEAVSKKLGAELTGAAVSGVRGAAGQLGRRATRAVDSVVDRASDTLELLEERGRKATGKARSRARKSGTAARSGGRRSARTSRPASRSSTRGRTRATTRSRTSRPTGSSSRRSPGGRKASTARKRTASASARGRTTRRRTTTTRRSGGTSRSRTGRQRARSSR